MAECVIATSPYLKKLFANSILEGGVSLKNQANQDFSSKNLIKKEKTVGFNLDYLSKNKNFGRSRDFFFTSTVFFVWFCLNATAPFLSYLEINICVQ